MKNNSPSPESQREILPQYFDAGNIILASNTARQAHSPWDNPSNPIQSARYHCEANETEPKIGGNNEQVRQLKERPMGNQEIGNTFLMNGADANFLEYNKTYC